VPIEANVFIGWTIKSSSGRVENVETKICREWSLLANNVSDWSFDQFDVCILKNQWGNVVDSI